MTDIVQAVVRLDDAVDLHLARLLILLNAFVREDGDGKIEGMTKLAKLDFLLRYPAMLERALKAKGRTIRDVELEEHEEESVESQMVRYRFGPWDHRYRELINILIAKDLASVDIDGRTIVMELTNKGRSVAHRLTDDAVFEPYARRSLALRRHFDMKATNLMRFIYDTFPEIVTLRSNEPI